jgi:hypothetical protein
MPTYQVIDFYFPFVVFVYGVVITFILNSTFFTELAEKRLPPQMWQQMQVHRILAIVSLVVGGLWSLQNLYIS